MGTPAVLLFERRKKFRITHDWLSAFFRAYHDLSKHNELLNDYHGSKMTILVANKHLGNICMNAACNYA